MAPLPVNHPLPLPVSPNTDTRLEKGYPMHSRAPFREAGYVYRQTLPPTEQEVATDVLRLLGSLWCQSCHDDTDLPVSTAVQEV